MQTAAEAATQALSNASKPPSSNGGRTPLKPDLLDYLWARMVARYGNRWTSQVGDSPSGLAGAEWAETVGAQTIDSLQRGFNADADRADGWPPSSSEFAALCRGQQPNSPDNVVRTYVSGHYHRAAPRIESDASRAAAKRELGALRKKLGIDIDLDATP